MKRNFVMFKSAALGWLVVVAVTIGLALRQGPTFDSSILSLLPESDQQPLVRTAIEQMSASVSAISRSAEKASSIAADADHMATDSNDRINIYAAYSSDDLGTTPTTIGLWVAAVYLKDM